MHRMLQLAMLAAAISVTLADPADAGKRRSVAKVPKIAGGYTIAQIDRAASIKPAGVVTGFEIWRQPRTRWSRHTAQAESRGREAEALTRPPASPSNPVLKEFGLPYIPGVPLVAILLPPPPSNELARLRGQPSLSFDK
jgi:hypothetical protein